MEYYGFYGDDAWALADPHGPQQVWVSLRAWWDLTPLAHRLSPDGQRVAELVRVNVGVRYPVESPYASLYASTDDEASEPPSPMVLESPQSPTDE
jgi:hypothetical protein